MSKTNKPNSQQIGRSAITGQFVSIPNAIRNPKTTVIETIKRPSRKTTKN